MEKKIKIRLLFLFIGWCGYSFGFQSVEYAQNLTGKELLIVADSISVLLSKYHYNPAELHEDEYITLEKKVKDLAIAVGNEKEFIKEFNTLWADGPFSHVNLAIAQMKAVDMANYIDNLRVGNSSVALEWDEGTAVLKVTTMTGVDTMEKLYEAYREIAAKKPDALVIDLRNNSGGTFAIIPLIGHLLTDSYDAGVFVSRKWWRINEKVPENKDFENLKPWEGWSIKSFWHDVQEAPLTRIQFQPMTPKFQGPVYVLINKKSASATEFAVDVLATLENVTIIGESTAGKMLSQKMYDLPYGLQLSLPIAEYYSLRIGRIEGKGVAPDILIDGSAAMDLALRLTKGVGSEEAIKATSLEANEKDAPVFGAEKLYLFGTMNDWGKQWSNAPQFEYKGEGIYVTKFTFTKGSYEFKIAPMSWDFDYGARSDAVSLKVGEVTPLVRIPGSDNLRIQLDETSELTIMLDVNDIENATIQILRD